MSIRPSLLLPFCLVPFSSLCQSFTADDPETLGTLVDPVSFKLPGRTPREIVDMQKPLKLRQFSIGFTWELGTNSSTRTLNWNSPPTKGHTTSAKWDVNINFIRMKVMVDCVRSNSNLVNIGIMI